MTVLYTRRAVVQAALEATSGVAAAVGVNDGVLVTNPMFDTQIDTLTRDIVASDFSPQANITGRIQAKAKFTCELRSNGKRSGSLADLPMLARLFAACGMAITANASPSIIGPFDTSANQGGPLVTFAAGAAPTNTDVIDYTITITTGGASGVAQASVASSVPGETNAAAAFTSGSAFTVGSKGVKVTPSYSGALVAGQTFQVWALPPGFTLQPISDGFQSATIVMNMSGVQHTIPGCFGTFSIKAEAGKFGTVDFDFTGIYQAPVDVTNLPVPLYERQLPAKIELSRVLIDNFPAIAKSYSFDIKNEIQIREDMSSVEGYIGTRIVDREPEGGFDPEADLVGNHDFWTRLRTAKRMPFSLRAGTQVGNTIWLFHPATQYTGLSYQDRNKILTFQAGLHFAKSIANDEAFIHFT